MPTWIFNKTEFIEQMKEYINDSEFVILTTTLCGKVSGARKKVQLKTVEMGFRADFFKSPETISDLMGSKLAMILACKEEVLSDSIKQEIRKLKGDKK